MKKAVVLMLLGGLVAWNLLHSSASALPAFKKAFEDKYVTPSGNADFAAAFKAASCNTCHVKGKDKKERNAYGQALAKFTGGKAAATLKAAKAQGDAAAKAAMDDILKKLGDGFDKAESEKSPSGPTYGELIKSGKLPASP